MTTNSESAYEDVYLAKAIANKKDKINLNTKVKNRIKFDDMVSVLTVWLMMFSASLALNVGVSMYQDNVDELLGVDNVTQFYDTYTGDYVTKDMDEDRALEVKREIVSELNIGYYKSTGNIERPEFIDEVADFASYALNLMVVSVIVFALMFIARLRQLFNLSVTYDDVCFKGVDNKDSDLASSRYKKISTKLGNFDVITLYLFSVVLFLCYISAMFIFFGKSHDLFTYDHYLALDISLYGMVISSFLALVTAFFMKKAYRNKIELGTLVSLRHSILEKESELVEMRGRFISNPEMIHRLNERLMKYPDDKEQLDQIRLLILYVTKVVDEKNRISDEFNANMSKITAMQKAVGNKT